jgi:hypothetical protein
MRRSLLLSALCGLLACGWARADQAEPEDTKAKVREAEGAFFRGAGFQPAMSAWQVGDLPHISPLTPALGS